MFQFAEEAYGTESKIIVMDFNGGADIYDDLGEKLAGLDIGILGEYTDFVLKGGFHGSAHVSKSIL